MKKLQKINAAQSAEDSLYDLNELAGQLDSLINSADAQVVANKADPAVVDILNNVLTELELARSALMTGVREHFDPAAYKAYNNFI